ncbi:class I SAM-dependent methyltransferase [Actinoplanes sp. KI2]|uniref:class I SAM-dependent DNA methyltransferase n=1 Tax=Actinoplanes sp. KI2 TaxID=2983315 RepID=UPI0021D5ECFF|nr:class I SAM-dependent methyltransferase [Actinoplanes sp. KI2]MCU7724875.1 class I SAM-dependent methyltransferase [Actinoplanes sp. KI2]
MSDIHRQRHVAESFGADAERYDKGRPSYPDAMIKRVVEASPGPAFLDVGIGTGIAARQLRAYGCQVLGIEVDDRMAAQARTHGLAVETARFEEWDPAGRRFDALVAAMTWHWIDPVAGAVKAAEVLGTGGLIALMWNVFDVSPAIKQAFAAVNARIVPDFPNPWAAKIPMAEAYQAILDTAIAGLRDSGSFAPHEQWRIDWELSYTRDEWLSVLPTFGGASRLPPHTLAELLTASGEAIDAAGGTLTVHYSTLTVAAKRA